MGAKFAPSIANLFMGEWEDKEVFHERRPELLFYRRYIDDLQLLWAGSESSLKEYLDHLNDNTHNIKLTSQWSLKQIHFLDLNIFRVENRLQTKVFFKPTDRNSFLPTHSGHHPLWLKNVPKGQMMRVRRNCSTLEDFDQQSSVLKKRFEDKGYKPQHLDSIVEEIRALP